MNSVAISFKNNNFPIYRNWEINRSHSTHHYYYRHQQPFELSPYNCSICQQHFQSEKILNRHIRSKKHLKRLSEISGNSFEPKQKWNLLPNKVIEAIIDDLKFDNKDEFFDGIQLLEDDNLNMASSNTVPDADLSQYSNFTNRVEKKKIITAHRIPSIYPCAMCFHSLDSQEDFERHMQSTHIYFSIGAHETNH